MKAPDAETRSVPPAAARTPTVRPERLSREFEDLGLPPAEARVIVALLQLGSARSSQLSKAAAVPRTAVYQLLSSLQDKGLILRVPIGGPATWTTPGRDKIIDRLHQAVVTAQQELVQQHALRSTLVKELLAEALPAPEPLDLPFVHIITCPAELRDEHERLICQATDEALLFSRPPFSTNAATAHDVTMDALTRGVSVKVLYQAAQAEDPEATTFRASTKTYTDAGMQARVVDLLPVKLLVVDRRALLLSLDNPLPHVEALGVTQVIEHPGLASMMAQQFDQLWVTARPLPADGRSREAKRPHPRKASRSNQ